MTPKQEKELLKIKEKWHHWKIDLWECIVEAFRVGKREGIKLAACVATDYDKYNSHPYLVSDCILGKLNVLKGKPRKNRRKA